MARKVGSRVGEHQAFIEEVGGGEWDREKGKVREKVQ